METLYRKVMVSERNPLKSGSYYTNIDKSFYRKSTGEFENIYEHHVVYPTFWLEEIPENSQIQKLQEDKAELLEILEKVTDFLEIGYPDFSAVRESKNIIQKHKQ